MEGKGKIPWLITASTILGQSAISLYIPAFPQIADDLGVDPVDVKSTLTMFFIGFGISQIIYGPLSDKVGRKPSLLFGIALFCAACLANIFAHSLGYFLLVRFIQGLGAGSVITICRSILRDCFSGKELNSATSHSSMGFAIAIGITPIVGAYLQTYFGWRADFVFLFLLGIALFITIAMLLPETRSIEKQNEIHGINEFAEILKDTTFWRYLLGGVFAYSVVVTWNVLSPFLIQENLHYSANAYGWMTLAVAIPYYFAAHYNRQLVHKFHLGKIFTTGMVLICLAGIAMLFDDNLLLILIPVFVATFGQALIFSNTIAASLQNYPHLPGKSSALYSMFQMTLVGMITALLSVLPDESWMFGVILITLSVLIYLFLPLKKLPE